MPRKLLFDAESSHLWPCAQWTTSASITVCTINVHYMYQQHTCNHTGADPGISKWVASCWDKGGEANLACLSVWNWYYRLICSLVLPHSKVTLRKKISNHQLGNLTPNVSHLKVCPATTQSKQCNEEWFRPLFFIITWLTQVFSF